MTFENIKKQIDIIRLQIEKLIVETRGKEFKKTIPNLYPPKYIIIHHGGGNFTFSQVNNHHKKKWGFESSLGFYAGYQYFIEFSGLLYKARRETEEGAHTVGPTPYYYNRNSIGICLQGNTNEKKPTESQLYVLEHLIDRIKLEYHIPNDKVKGHRELQATDCPGKHLWAWAIKNYPD